MANLVSKFKYSDLARNPSNGSYSKTIITIMWVNKMHFYGHVQIVICWWQCEIIAQWKNELQDVSEVWY